MEHWTISGDGNGNFVIYPTALLGGGILILFILGIIKAATKGAAMALTAFANQYSWLVVLIIVILGLAIAVLVGLIMKKELLFPSILFGISLPLSLSLIYGLLMDLLINIATGFEELFLVTLFWAAPIAIIIFAVLAILALAIGFSPCIIGVICRLEGYSVTSIHKAISIALGLVFIPIMFYFLYAQTSLPLYLMGCA